jgi:hypothetical protein
MKFRSIFAAAAVLAFALVTAQSSFADGIVLTPPDGAAGPILGTIYTNIPDAGNANDAGNYSAALQHASFYTSGISYNSNIDGYTNASFLHNPTFFNATGGFDPNGVADNIGIEFTGSTYLNAGANNFVVPHDDGLTLTISGVTVLFQPGPTSPVDTPFTVTVLTAGYYTFDLRYVECCGAPAVLGFEVNDIPVGTAPEPGSLALLGTGLCGVAGMIRRKLVK